MRNESDGLGCFLHFFATILGALLGWAMVEFLWRGTHSVGIHMWVPLPKRGIDYWLMAAFCSLSGAVLGLAFARWRDLADEKYFDEQADKPN